MGEQFRSKGFSEKRSDSPSKNQTHKKPQINQVNNIQKGADAKDHWKPDLASKPNKKPDKNDLIGKQYKGQDLDISSIRSDASDYIPNRREVGGRKIDPQKPVKPNKNAGRLIFEDEDKNPPHVKFTNLRLLSQTNLIGNPVLLIKIPRMEVLMYLLHQILVF